MIGLLSALDRSICRWCGNPIILWKSDIEKEPYWSHSDSGQQPCPGASMATPATQESSDADRAYLANSLSDLRAAALSLERQIQTQKSYLYDPELNPYELIDKTGRPILGPLLADQIIILNQIEKLEKKL